MYRYIAGAVLALGLLGSACSNDSSGEPSLYFGDAEGIIEQRVDGSTTTTLIAVPSERDTFRDPAVSPDGSSIAYVHAPPYVRTAEGVLDIHADLWIADRDGSNPRMVYQHSRPTETITMPQWLDDETILAQLTYKVDPTTPGNANTRTLVRVDVDSGERSDILDKVIAFTISPDGTSIAFTAIKSIEEQPIYIAASDDTTPAVLVDSSTGLGGFSGLVFSADGRTLYFGAHEEEEVRLASRAASGTSSHTQQLRLLHEEAVDLWSVDVAGGTPRFVAEMEVTDPHFARGETPEILYVLAGWLGRIDFASGDVSQVSDPDVSGSISFAE